MELRQGVNYQRAGNAQRKAKKISPCLFLWQTESSQGIPGTFVFLEWPLK
jgi:hypothetical protein